MYMEGYSDDEMEERRSIRNSGKALKKYGSTAKHIKRNEILVKHTVSKADTLQGIALKFGVTTEQIRRANRLWATDSLFLREYLLIPVPVDNPLSMQSNDVSTESESNHTIASTSRSSSMSSSLDQESSVDDFLARMDSSIASVKKEVKRAQGNSEFCHDGDDSYVQKRKAVARLRNSHPVTSNSYTSVPTTELVNSVSSGDVHSLPSTVVMTQGRRVKTSLQRLQQQQDEMFQL